MLKRIYGWLQNVLDMAGLPRAIGEAIAMVGLAIIAIRRWVYLDTTDMILLGISLLGLLIVGLTFFYEWRKNRNVRQIPDLLIKMDEKMKCLIAVAKYPQERLEKFHIDAGELWDIDITRLKQAQLRNDLAEIKQMFEDYINKPSIRSPYSPTQTKPQPLAILVGTLTNLTGLMNFHEIGINSIKDKEYLMLEKQFRILERRLANIKTIKHLNNYEIWWEGLCNYILLDHYSPTEYLPPEVLPAKAKAVIPNIHFFAQIAVNEYMGYVKDSIYSHHKKETAE